MAVNLYYFAFTNFYSYEEFISGRSASHPVPAEAGGVGHRLTLG